FERALELFTELGDLAGQARTHLRFNWVLDRQGRLPESLHHAHEARRLAEAAGHRRALAGALNAIGWLYSLLGQHDQTLVYCRQAVTVCQEIGDEQTEADSLDSLGHAYHHLGRC